MNTNPIITLPNTPIKLSTRAKCYECARVFDLTNELDADEWAYGHDCEDLD